MLEDIPTSICVEPLVQWDQKQDSRSLLARPYQRQHQPGKRRGSVEARQIPSEHEEASPASSTRPPRRRGSTGKQISTEYDRASSVWCRARPPQRCGISSRFSDRDRSQEGHKQQHRPVRRTSGSLEEKQSTLEYDRASPASTIRPRSRNSRDSTSTNNQEFPLPPPRTVEKRRTHEQKKSTDAEARVPSKSRHHPSGRKDMTDAQKHGRAERRVSNANRKSENRAECRSSDNNKYAGPPKTPPLRNTRAPTNTQHKSRQQSSRPPLESERQQRLGEPPRKVARNPSHQTYRHTDSLGRGGGDNIRHASFSSSMSSLSLDGPSNSELKIIKKQAMGQERLQQVNCAFHLYKEDSKIAKAMTMVVDVSNKKESNGASSAAKKKRGGLSFLWWRRNNRSKINQQDDNLDKTAHCFDRDKEGRTKECASNADALPSTISQHMDVELPAHLSSRRTLVQMRQSMPTNLHAPSTRK